MHNASHMNASLDNATAVSLFDMELAAATSAEALRASVIFVSYMIHILFVMTANKATANESASKKMKNLAVKSLATAVVVGILTVAAIAVPLYCLNDTVSPAGWQAIMWALGSFKLIGAVLLTHLSVAAPRRSLTRYVLAIGVSLNIYRDVCAIGFALLDVMLSDPPSDRLLAIPLSVLVGLAISVAIGVLLYMLYAILAKIGKTRVLTISSTIVLDWVICGLFASAFSAFEGAMENVAFRLRNESNITLNISTVDEVVNETGSLFPTPNVFDIPGCDASMSNCTVLDPSAWPAALAVPFGYSVSPTVVTFSAFWACALLLVIAHIFAVKYIKRRAAPTTEENVQAAPATEVVESVEKTTGATAMRTRHVRPLKFLSRKTCTVMCKALGAMMCNVFKCLTGVTLLIHLRRKCCKHTKAVAKGSLSKTGSAAAATESSTPDRKSSPEGSHSDTETAPAPALAPTFTRKVATEPPKKKAPKPETTVTPPSDLPKPASVQPPKEASPPSNPPSAPTSAESRGVFAGFSEGILGLFSPGSSTPVPDAESPVTQSV